MTDQPIKTRADGSIDTDYYMRRGRRMRSEAAHAMFGPSGESKKPTVPFHLSLPVFRGLTTMLNRAT